MEENNIIGYRRLIAWQKANEDAHRRTSKVSALFFILPILASCLLIHVSTASAATLRVVATPASADLHQPVRVDVALDTQGDVANALQGEIIFPAGIFHLEEINDGASPISFWVEPPTETASGTVAFSEIVPGGFAGAASSVISLVLDPIAPGNAAISLGDISLLRNDGQGTAMPVTTSSAAVTISANLFPGASASSSSSASNSASLEGSDISPELFTPVVSRDPDVYGGKYFLAFSTTDKGSGIDHYEVAEIPAGTALSSSTAWQVATSPYLIQDQSLSSDIYVRAVDHAGNATIAKVSAQKRNGALWEWGAIIAVILLAALAGLWLGRRRGRGRGGR